MFDVTITRWGTHSAKWDLLAAHLGEDALSLSVADMEFATCPEVSRAIVDACAEGIFGYTEVFDDFREAAARWQERRHGWALEPGDVHFSRASSSACRPCARSSCRGRWGALRAW